MEFRIHRLHQVQLRLLILFPRLRIYNEKQKSFETNENTFEFTLYSDIHRRLVLEPFETMKKKNIDFFFKATSISSYSSRSDLCRTHFHSTVAFSRATCLLSHRFSSNNLEHRFFFN